MSEKSDRILIIGGGIAGLTVASSLGKLGYGSVIVEKEAKPGGHLREHHTTFPHQHLASDILAEHEKPVNENSDIELLTNSQVGSITGEAGAFEASIITTGEDGKDSTQTLNVGAVVVATGFEGIDASTLNEYSYSLHPNIISGLEFDKILNDKIIAGEQLGRPTDGTAPKSAAVIMCSGSRDEKHNRFCCEVGCRAGLNHALYLKETFGTGIQVYVFYIDVRATGRDNEDLYKRVREADVHFIKGRPSEIRVLDEHSSRFDVFDMVTHKLLQFEADLIILETALVPRESQANLNDILELKSDDTGFIASEDYYRPFAGSKKGVFVAGSASGPKDLPQTISNSAMVAVEVAKLLREG